MRSRTPNLELNLAKRKVARRTMLKVPTASSCPMVDCRSWNTRPIRKDTDHRSATRTLEPDIPVGPSRGDKEDRIKTTKKKKKDFLLLTEIQRFICTL
jgi:hypothetical protein